MCGFIGKISNSDINIDKIKDSNGHLICRGPDSTKIFNQRINNLNVLLIFNRLKIVDLSDNANQPMQNPETESVIVFNGEIFNHLELRNNLEKQGLKFNTKNSDTEVLLKGLDFYGIDYINKLRGQFSFCFINRKLQTAYIVSDRFNQKPMYFNFQNDSFTFSSNLISLVNSLKNVNLSNKYISEYIEYGIVSSPNTVFENVYKLEPAQVIEIDLLNVNKINKSYIYWDVVHYVDSKKFKEEEFFEYLDDAIKIRQQADVPIANFLSGGIDSTSIIKNMHDRGDNINSFSIVFNEPKYNEMKWSRLVADRYQTNHTEINASTNLDIETINNALNSLDEPYADPSVVPSYIISDKISKYYKVAISGDGGDELLGGYKRVQDLLRPRTYLENVISKGYNFYPPFLGSGNFFLSKSVNLNSAYNSFFQDEKFINLLKIESNKNFKKIRLDLNFEPYKSMLIQDYKYYLPEMMMLKVDRTSMANSLEVRSPFVDHLLVQYIMSTGVHSDRLNINKTVLKKYLTNDFSNTFINRKKQGFIFDLEKWIYGNIPIIKDRIIDGKYTNFISKKIIFLLSINKSRINANRIWKLYLLEVYLSKFKFL